MSFTKALNGYRRVATRVGDSLQAIAAREMGDAARWPDLAQINNLMPPYITDDPALAGSQVLLSGAPIMLPTAAPPSTGVADAHSMFGCDIALTNGRIEVTDGGDLRLTEGVANLNQALRHALATDPGDLLFHQGYGCPARTLIGRPGGEVNNQLAAMFVARTLRADPRVARVENPTADIQGDGIAVTATAVTVDGQHLPVGMGMNNAFSD
ncbi:hypothetical protein [Azospirillum sp. TSO22-1]|uniref:hypothetical protein n=1 Tax=Azospirillum sp. TSO22-1 TaxID=716789 RepID=UPI000D622B19|nr:hypothetical protein [Azospirillum sp. TSO22-1]PWC44270.1 hypothetical protein TSO221_18425 [Azospirillum sp. TSO22-1]